jgi:hypothetical protein
MSVRRFAVVVALLLCTGASSQTAYTTYFVAVGSGDYAAPPSGWHGFEKLDGASASAQRVASLLLRGGARFGIVLVSAPGRYVSGDDVFHALKDVIDRARSDGAPRPLIVFYIMSHGVSEGIGWNHFSVPGTFVYRGASDLTIEQLQGSAIYAGDVADALDRSKMPYIALFDNCSSGRAATFASSVLSANAQRNLQDVSALVRTMNEFRQSSPVMFSTAPGTETVPVDDPIDRESTVEIGPLSRRLSIVFTNALNTHRSVSTADFVRSMTSKALDVQTMPAVTHAELDTDANGDFWMPAQAKGKAQTRYGTAKRAAPPK